MESAELCAVRGLHHLTTSGYSARLLLAQGKNALSIGGDSTVDVAMTILSGPAHDFFAAGYRASCFHIVAASINFVLWLPQTSPRRFTRLCFCALLYAIINDAGN